MANSTAKLTSKLVYGVALGVCLVCIQPAGSVSPMPQTKETLAMMGIENNSSLTTAQKLEQLNDYFGKVPLHLEVLSFLMGCDKTAARDSALKQFRKPDTSTYHKLECGRFLLTWSTVPTPDFIAEYAPFLIDAVLKQGSDEFMKVRENDSILLSAVGEYAFIASGFNGHNPKHFETLKDRRVIPVLIHCLDAPDYTPGPPFNDRRNVERQEIPIALARLDAIEATEKLKQVLKTHHDWYLRFNSAYALGFMLPRSESAKIEQFINNLKEEGARSLFFGFGSGLVERGDAAGIQYLSFKYSPYYEDKNIPVVLYMLQERLGVLQKSKVKDAAALSAFYQSALTYAPLRAMLEFDAAKLEYSLGPTKKDTPEKRLAEVEAVLVGCKDDILACYKAILADLKRHGITALSGIIAEIGERTRRKEIRALSRE